MTDVYGGQAKAKETLGDAYKLVPRPRKHRYVYFNCAKKEKNFLMSQLKYKPMNYPKNNEGVDI